MTRRVIIYGVFNRRGKCLYIGRTKSAGQRAYQHAHRFGPHATFRVLKEVSFADANRTEKRLIMDYWRKGEARHNIAGTPRRPRAFKMMRVPDTFYDSVDTMATLSGMEKWEVTLLLKPVLRKKINSLFQRMIEHLAKHEGAELQEAA